MGVKVIICILSIVIGISLRFFKHGDSVKLLIRLCLIQIGAFIIYHIFQRNYYIAKNAYDLGMSILRLIPLQLCYFCLITTLIGLIKRNKPLLATGFFLLPLSGGLVILLPDSTFSGMSLLNPFYFMFIIVHMFLVIIGIGIYSMDVYRPSYSDIPKVFIYMAAFVPITYAVNCFCALFNEYPNYLYTFSTGGHPLLVYCYSLLPNYPFYLYILLAVLTGIIFVEFSILKLCGAVRKKYSRGNTYRKR